MLRLTRMKLDRAKQRMKELEEALQSFYATNPFKFSGKADLQAGKVVYTMDSVKDAPDEAFLTAGAISTLEATPGWPRVGSQSCAGKNRH
jgi:hypothetical protein